MFQLFQLIVQQYCKCKYQLKQKQTNKKNNQQQQQQKYNNRYYNQIFTIINYNSNYIL